eukprot:GFUD01109574.1.p1 GENE.GFUD01109574.1~~GFUD01109574.1.p1  ORF type:complete len:277 (+),score=72.30 GFUD01109574.1:163-993(+)
MVLSGRLALVTGGGRGIGRAVCQVLARDNARVVVTDLSMESCQETMQSLRPDDHFSVSSDVSQSASVNDCFKQILDKYKRAPDIIVNSAGITRDGFMLRMKEEDFDKVIDVNLKGTFLVTQAAASLMKDQQLSGSIVNIASIVGKTGNVGQANYTASKAGVIGFTKTAAKELGKFGIRVNVILPGFIKTPMTDVVPDKLKLMVQFQIPLSKTKTGNKGEERDEEDTWKRRLAERLIGRPLGDFGDPEDIAETAAFLASHRSKYMTGASIDVNGGLL